MKKLNEKLNDRVDFLQSIIDKEASANTFYYNYPPKADDTLKVATKDKKVDNEGQKVKKMYEDQMEQLKKQYESMIKQLKQSMSEQVEDLTQLFSDASKDLVSETVEHRALQKKFNDYYSKTDAYQKQLEGEIQDLKNEVKRLNEEYSSFDQRFAQRKTEGE